jgi:hypothetical protein
MRWLKWNRQMFAAVLSLACSACAWNPVLTPYEITRPAGTASPGTATIWGGADGAGNHFLEVDGVRLPSRKGGGYPLAITLPAGSYQVKMLYLSHNNYAEISQPVTVQAGHTYAVKNVMRNVGGRLVWDPELEDLGKGMGCHYERLNQLRGDVRLICQPVGERATEPGLPSTTVPH